MEPAAVTSPGAGRPEQGALPLGDAPARPPKRRVRNFLLDTSLQLRLASYLVAVATALSIALGWLLWQAYRETSRVVALGDPEMGDSIAQALASEDRWRIVLVSAALAGVLLCLLCAAVVITHRIAGPAYAIARTCRHVAEGNLTPPRPLRSRDLLTDLADDVAGMLEALRQREARERDLALQIAAKIRDPSASAADRAAAAEDLERLATEKGTRLGS
jgi:methyl-accepting chemotaxis protein